MTDDQEEGVETIVQVESNSLYCWREPARECGGDCVAYDDRCQGNPVFSPCLLLNIKRSLAVSISGLEKAFQGSERARKNKELADRANIEPPKVNP
jgi:hypothetical protein